MINCPKGNEILNNARTDVDIAENDNLLRRIRVERRDLNRQLADLYLQWSFIENNVGEEHEHDTDDQDEEEDAEEVGAADTQDLDDDRTDEYNRLHNLLCRTKVDIKARKKKVEKPHPVKETVLIVVESSVVSFPEILFPFSDSLSSL